MSLSLLSPLFPYTTLFRSPFPCPLVGLVCAAAHGLESGGHPVERFPRGGGGEASAWAARLPRSGVLALSGAVDRKSTRLNSSHVAISYAVFCLKKKIGDNN